MDATTHGIVSDALLTYYCQWTITKRASCIRPSKVGGAPHFPFAPSCAKKENIHSPGRRAALMPREKLSEHSHHRPTFQVCTFELKRRSLRLLGRHVSFTGLGAVHHWR